MVQSISFCSLSSRQMLVQTANKECRLRCRICVKGTFKAQFFWLSLLKMSSSLPLNQFQVFVVFFTQRLIKKSLPRGCFPWSFANYLVEHMEVHTTMKIISRSTGKPINLNNSLELGYSRYLLAQSQQWKYQNNMWNISKLNNVVLVSLLLTLNRFVHIACVLPLLTLNQQMTAGSISLFCFCI